MKRREFIRNSALAASLASISPLNLFANKKGLSGTGYFGINSFIEDNPHAVFIFKTDLGTDLASLDAAATLKTSQDLAASLFVSKTQEEGGYPVTTPIAIKPNLNERADATLGSLGVQVDVNFFEGILDRLIGTEIGIAPANIDVRETWTRDLNNYTSYVDLFNNKGIGFKEFIHYELMDKPSWSYDEFLPEDINIVDVPGGEYFKRIPYLAPFGSPNAFIINVAKLKSHWIGITGCAKNLQGTQVGGYVRNCFQHSSYVNNTNLGANINTDDIYPDAGQKIENNLQKRLNEGIPYYSQAESYNNFWFSAERVETWVMRCMDNHKVLKPQLNILEGIYSREGAIAVNGQQPGDFKQPMSNIVLIGLNPFAIDVVATKLAGHEPGNFGWIHAMHEKGLCPLNPDEIPVYEWSLTGVPVQKTLADFNAEPLRVGYLGSYLKSDGDKPYRTYDWVMRNDPYDYGTNSTGTSMKQEASRGSKFITGNYPNPAFNKTTINYEASKSGHVRVEVLDMKGKVVKVLKEGYISQGTNQAVWLTGNNPPGIYFCRIHLNGYTDVLKMQVIK